MCLRSAKLLWGQEEGQSGTLNIQHRGTVFNLFPQLTTITSFPFCMHTIKRWSQLTLLLSLSWLCDLLWPVGYGRYDTVSSRPNFEEASAAFSLQGGSLHEVKKLRSENWYMRHHMRLERTSHVSEAFLYLPDLLNHQSNAAERVTSAIVICNRRTAQPSPAWIPDLENFKKWYLAVF